MAAASRDMAVAFVLILAVSLLTRGWTFGNPVIHVDEQFYLTVGDRLLRGELPYVDIWDIKPIGLFALYAAIAGLFPGSIVAYQVAALGSVVLTAMLLFAVARRVAGRLGALMCCAAYPAWLTVFDGIGGQSEVFLNLPVTAAAALCLARFTGPARSRGGLPAGAAVMLLVGLGLQIKYSALFQGVFFGLFMLGALVGSRRPAYLLACVGAWVATALAPTLLALALYAAAGHADAFIYANFVSILHRHNSADDSWALLWKQLAVLAPFWCGVAIAALARRRSTGAQAGRVTFVLLWNGASVAGYLLFGGFHHSYVLPLLPALCVAAAIAADRFAVRRRWLVLAAGAALIAMGAGVGLVRVKGKGVSPANRAQIAMVTQAVQARLDGGCLYVFDGPPILYYLTHACTVTRFLFPSHLSTTGTAAELGIDSVSAELRRTLARRPRVVVARSVEAVRAQPGDPVTQRLIRAELARHFQRLPGLDRTGLDVWVRCPTEATPCGTPST